jgi:hypothetical protein
LFLSWNIDKNERAIDVTYADTDNYDYYGIEIPFEQIWPQNVLITRMLSPYFTSAISKYLLNAYF